MPRVTWTLGRLLGRGVRRALSDVRLLRRSETNNQVVSVVRHDLSVSQSLEVEHSVWRRPAWPLTADQIVEAG